ncbi:MAG: hypothetical protein R2797_06415 [Gelidibacter sp.]
MYNRQVIERKFNNAENREMKYYILSHILLEVILENSREESTEEEYLEALIFTAFMITQRMQHSIAIEETKKFMIMEIYKYVAENYELDDFVDSIDSQIFPFIIKRFSTIANELSELEFGSGYLLPLLLNNLYINPTNDSNESIDEIMQNMDLKLPITFKIKFKNFIDSLDNSIKSFEADGY